MKHPDALYVFKRGHYLDKKGREVKNNWLFVEKQGKDVNSPYFPAKWERPPKGLETDLYITYRKTQNKKQRERYPMSFSLGSYKNEKKKKRQVRGFTGVDPRLDPLKLYGDDKNIGLNDAVMFEFSPDKEILKIWFFFGEADSAFDNWESWTAGKLNMTVEPIPAEKENADSLF